MIAIFSLQELGGRNEGYIDLVNLSGIFGKESTKVSLVRLEIISQEYRIKSKEKQRGYKNSVSTL